MATSKTVDPILRRIRRGILFILNVRVDNVDWRSALHAVHVFATSDKGTMPHTLYFANVHTIHLARKNTEFLRAVNFADLVLPDGSGLKLAGRTFGTPIHDNLNGTDFTPLVLRCAQTEGWTVYLFGARPEVVSACRDALARTYPQLCIIGDHSGYYAPEEETAIVDDINAKRPDILLVALGSPLQELWIVRHLRQLEVGVCLAVGGLFDFLAGTRKRAPGWMRSVGLEWLYRFLQDPTTKWRRVFVEIPMFLALLFTARFAPRRLRAALLEEFIL